VDCCAGPWAVQRDPGSGQMLGAVSTYLSKAIYTDVLTFVSSRRLYAFPLGCLIDRLVAHILETALDMVMVVPWWHTQSCWAQVVGRESMVLGKVREVVVPGASGARHPFGRRFEEDVAAETELVAIAFRGQRRR
jgi:hypothetical protein